MGRPRVANEEEEGPGRVQCREQNGGRHTHTHRRARAHVSQRRTAYYSGHDMPCVNSLAGDQLGQAASMVSAMARRAWICRAFTHVCVCVCVCVLRTFSQLFFAKVLRSANEEDVKRLFSQYGKVYDVNLFRAFQGAPTTKVLACTNSH